MPLPILPVVEVGRLESALGVSCRDAFVLNGAVHVGCQSTAWQGDFTESGGCWSRWKGRWDPRKGAPSRAVPSNLAVWQDGAPVTLEGGETFPVARLAENTGFEARAGVMDGAGTGAAQIEWCLYNAATGALTARVTGALNLTQNVGAFAGVAAGSYQLCARLFGITQTPITAEFYQQITGVALIGEYFYDEAGTRFFWDWKRNLGRLPLDLSHPFYALRAALVAKHEQLDRPEWATYLTGGGTDDGEWSFLRVQVGAGAWTLGANAIPSPGPALRRQGATETDWPGVGFDAGARCVSVSKEVFWGNGLADGAVGTQDGDVLLAGTRATRSGPVAALWRFRGGVYTLLGWNRDASDGRCQCAKRNHGPNGIIELRDGTILLLSECSLLIYKPEVADLSRRLVNFPDEGRETPGGYSLRLIDGARRFNFFTENFGGGVAGEVNFYNRLQEIVAGRIATGVGTRWHGRECSAALGGSLYGWSQDAPESEANAQMWLSRLVEGRWVRDVMDSYPAKDYLWRQIVSCGGKLIGAGTRVLSGANVAEEFETGKRAGAVWGVASGGAWQEFDSPYIPIYLTTCESEGAQFVLAIARKVDANGLLLADEYVIRIDSALGDEAVPADGFASAQDVVDSFPPGFCYQSKVIQRETSGAAWDALEVGDRGALETVNGARIRPLERLGATYPNLWARVDSSAPQSDLSTFNIRVPWGARLALPVPCRRKIEVWVAWSCDLSPVTLPAIDPRQ